MERANTKFLIGLRTLNRNIASHIFNPMDLYPTENGSIMADREMISKVKERNKRYLENRQRKKQLDTYDSIDNHTFDNISRTRVETMCSSASIGTSNNILNQSSIVSTRDALSQIITSKGQQIQSARSLHQLQKAPVKPKITLPMPILDSEFPSHQRHRSLSPSKMAQLGIKSTKSTAHTSLILSNRSEQASPGPNKSQISISPSPSLRTLPKSTSLPKLSQFNHSPKLKQSARNFNSTNRIFNFVTESCEDLLQSIKRCDIFSKLERESKYRLVEQIYKSNLENIKLSIAHLESALDNLEDKAILEDYMTEFATAAMKSHNIELHLIALKSQARIYIKYKDFFRAVVIYKSIRRVSDYNINLRDPSNCRERNNHYFKNKLFAYRHLTKCFQELENYKIAIFYCVKWLQTAWIIQSKDDELAAYDALGVQYFYIGEAETSQYYHDRMMRGTIEPMSSEMRILGVEKLRSHILDRNYGPKKQSLRIKTKEEELYSQEYPESEDEYELPNHQKAMDELKKEHDRENESSGIKKLKVVNYALIMHLREKSQKRKGTRQHNNNNKPLMEAQHNEAKMQMMESGDQPNVPVMLNHLSPNRLLKNFNIIEAKDILHSQSYLKKDSQKKGFLSRQALTDLAEDLHELKSNLEVAYKKVDDLLEIFYQMKND